MDPEKEKKELIIISIIAVIALVALSVWYFRKNAPINFQDGSTGQNSAPFRGSETRQPVGENVSIPDENSSVSTDVAKPQIVAQASPGSLSSLRIFSLNVSANGFEPNTIIVKAGDTVHLNIKAVGKNYDFFQPDYGLSKLLPNGETTVVEFQATAADKYTFYCKACGGPKKGPVGYIVVVTKK